MQYLINSLPEETCTVPYVSERILRLNLAGINTTSLVRFVLFPLNTRVDIQPNIVRRCRC